LTGFTHLAGGVVAGGENEGARDYFVAGERRVDTTIWPRGSLSMKQADHAEEYVGGLVHTQGIAEAAG
jgi:hypothetical protein